MPATGTTTRTQVPAPRTTSEGTSPGRPALTLAEMIVLSACTTCGRQAGHIPFCIEQYGQLDRD